MFIAISATPYKKAKKQTAANMKPFVLSGDEAYILAKTASELRRLLIQEGKHFEDYLIFDLFDNKGEANDHGII